MVFSKQLVVETDAQRIVGLGVKEQSNQKSHGASKGLDGTKAVLYSKRHASSDAQIQCGSGEYTTGFVGGAASTSDKKVGVVGLCLFDLRRRGKVGELSIVGTSGTKFPAIRKHLHQNISQAYNNLDTSFTSYPSSTLR